MRKRGTHISCCREQASHDPELEIQVPGRPGVASQRFAELQSGQAQRPERPWRLTGCVPSCNETARDPSRALPHGGRHQERRAAGAPVDPALLDAPVEPAPQVIGGARERAEVRRRDAWEVQLQALLDGLCIAESADADELCAAQRSLLSWWNIRKASCTGCLCSCGGLSELVETSSLVLLVDICANVKISWPNTRCGSCGTVFSAVPAALGVFPSALRCQLSCSPYSCYSSQRGSKENLLR